MALERVTALPASAMATVALGLIATELVHRLPPFSRALGQVTLDLASGMMKTHLSLPFS